MPFGKGITTVLFSPFAGTSFHNGNCFYYNMKKINTTLIRNKSYKSVCILFLKIFRRKFYFYRSHKKKGHTIRYLGKTGFPLKARDFRWYVNRLYTPPERCLCALKEVVPIQNDYYPTNYTEYPLKW